MLDNILGGGYFGLVKEGVYLQSHPGDAEDKHLPVAVKTMKGIIKLNGVGNAIGCTVDTP